MLDKKTMCSIGVPLRSRGFNYGGTRGIFLINRASLLSYSKFSTPFTELVPPSELYKNVQIPDTDPLKDYRMRLLYRSTKNGIIENDIILGDFSRKYIGQLSQVQLEEFEVLLRENDWDIYKWCVKSNIEEIPEEWRDSEIIRLIRKFVVDVRLKGNHGFLGTSSSQ